MPEGGVAFAVRQQLGHDGRVGVFFLLAGVEPTATRFPSLRRTSACVDSDATGVLPKARIHDSAGRCAQAVPSQASNDHGAVGFDRQCFCVYVRRRFVAFGAMTRCPPPNAGSSPPFSVIRASSTFPNAGPSDDAPAA